MLKTVPGKLVLLSITADTLLSLQQLFGQDGHDQRPHGQVRQIGVESVLNKTGFACGCICNLLHCCM